MTQMSRTLAFVIAASASVIGAVVAHIVTRPPVPTDQAHLRIGEAFYPEFTDPTQATAIRVAAWNPRSNRVETFEVRNEDGQWRIPSHNDYPADARDQLARAAASAVGIVRGSLVSESADAAELERLGVIDPLDSNVSQGEGISGTRITLFENEQIIADFIIGRKQGDVAAPAAEDEPAADESAGKQEKEGRFYVRRPDEKLVYLADVNIDVSTKFRDWIHRDLLDLSQFDLRKIVVNRYSVDEEKGELIPGDVSELTRESSSDPWKLAGLDETTRRIKSGVVSAMARALDDLQIVGVRKKPEALVKFFTEGVVDLVQALQVQSDLQQHGFYFDGQHLYSNEGEIVAGAKDGVNYVLRFGEVFTGSDLEIEVGTAGGESNAADAEGEDAAPPAEKADANTSSDAKAPAEGDSTSADTEAAGESEEPAEEGTKRSRYVIVEATFDQSLLGPEPTPPVKPMAPEGVQPVEEGKDDAAKASQPPTEKAEKDAAAAADAPKPDAPAAEADDAAPKIDGSCDDAAADGAAADADSPSEPTADADKPAPAGDDTPAAESSPPPAQSAAAPAEGDAADDQNPVVRPKTPQDVYNDAMKQYEQDLEAYEAKKKDYDKQVEDGKKRVEELNKRFSEWYYVISADLFEDLSVSRDQLTEPVTPPEGEATTPAAAPAAPGADTPAKEPEPSADAAPADRPASPATPEPANAASPAGKPPAEAPETAKPADATPDAGTDAPKQD